jgi:hypothetical protein
VPGADHLLTSDDFLEMDELTQTMVFIGGRFLRIRPYCAVRAGAKVTILPRGSSVLLAILTRSMSVSAGADLEPPLEGRRG